MLNYIAPKNKKTDAQANSTITAETRLGNSLFYYVGNYYFYVVISGITKLTPYSHARRRSFD